MSESSQADAHARKPVGFLMGWGLPILIILGLNMSQGAIPAAIIVAVLAGAFAWMGIACLINARRCGRRHCFYSGPVFLAGAMAILLVGYGTVSLGPHGLMYVTWGTVGAVALSFVPELIWGRYVRSGQS